MLAAAVILLLLAIFVQDLRKRAVFWLFFPALFVLNLIWNPVQVPYVQWLWSLAFVVLLLTLLTLYLRLREGKWVKVWEGFFSLGDILFLLAIIPLFAPLHFVWFFTIGTILTLVLHLAVSPFSTEKSVPYAGYLALVTVPYVLFPESIQLFINRLGV